MKKVRTFNEYFYDDEIVSPEERESILREVALMEKELVARRQKELAKNTEMKKITEIVETIIEKRHKLSLSQKDLAKLCDIPLSSIVKIEAGKTNPKLSTLLKIFSQLGLKFSVSNT